MGEQSRIACSHPANSVNHAYTRSDEHKDYQRYAGFHCQSCALHVRKLLKRPRTLIDFLVDRWTDCPCLVCRAIFEETGWKRQYSPWFNERDIFTGKPGGSLEKIVEVSYLLENPTLGAAHPSPKDLDTYMPSRYGIIQAGSIQTL